VGAVKGALSRKPEVTPGDCEKVPVVREFRRPIAYDVDYVYRGMKYRSRLPYDPGNRLRVRVSVMPHSPERAPLSHHGVCIQHACVRGCAPHDAPPRRRRHPDLRPHGGRHDLARAPTAAHTSRWVAASRRVGYTRNPAIALGFFVSAFPFGVRR
jgi:hypothetical protein